MAKNRYSVTLSENTANMIRELKESTDADSDSEVFRNAIRLSYAILEAQKSGATLVLEDEDGIRTFLPTIYSMPTSSSPQAISH